MVIKVFIFYSQALPRFFIIFYNIKHLYDGPGCFADCTKGKLSIDIKLITDYNHSGRIQHLTIISWSPIISSTTSPSSLLALLGTRAAKTAGSSPVEKMVTINFDTHDA